MTIFKAAWWMLHFLNCKRNVYPLVICLTYSHVIWKKSCQNEQQDDRHKLNEEVRMKTRSSPFQMKLR